MCVSIVVNYCYLVGLLKEKTSILYSILFYFDSICELTIESLFIVYGLVQLQLLRKKVCFENAIARSLHVIQVTYNKFPGVNDNSLQSVDSIRWP